MPDGFEDARTRLQRVRETVLALHKALLDSERTAYEITHGNIRTPAAFLHLLINDPSFAWLQAMTNLIVRIDETLAAKKPPAQTADFEMLLNDTRALLSASTDDDSAFWRRYSAALSRDPAVAGLARQVEEQLDQR